MEIHLLKQPTIIYVAIQIKPTEELCGITMTESSFRDDPNKHNGYTAEKAVSLKCIIC